MNESILNILERDYSNITEIDYTSKNQLFSGYNKNGTKVFIKHYLIRPGKESRDILSTENELNCYDALADKLKLAHPLEYSHKDRYLVLPYFNYREVILNESTSDEIYSQLIDLQKVEKYEKVHEEKNIKQKYLENLDRFFNAFPEYTSMKTNIRNIIRSIEEPSILVFNHGDFRKRNLVVDEDNTIQVIDYEHVHMGDPMYDPACMWLSLWKYPEIQEDFFDKIRTNKYFKESSFWKYVLCSATYMIHFGLKGGDTQKVQAFKETITEIINNINK